MPTNIISLRKKLGLSQEKFARLLSVSISTIVRAEKLGNVPRGLKKPTENLLKIVERIKKAGSPEEITFWLTKPNQDLQGYQPIDLIGSDYATAELLKLIDSWS